MPCEGSAITVYMICISQYLRRRAHPHCFSLWITLWLGHFLWVSWFNSQDLTPLPTHGDITLPQKHRHLLSERNKDHPDLPCHPWAGSLPGPWRTSGNSPFLPQEWKCTCKGDGVRTDGRAHVCGGQRMKSAFPQAVHCALWAKHWYWWTQLGGWQLNLSRITGNT